MMDLKTYSLPHKVACDKETEFECPQSGTCISLASLCDGNVDCPLSEFDENESLCVTTPSTTTTSTISITKATSLATPAPNGIFFVLYFINPFPKQSHVFTCLQLKSFENTGKRRNCS